MDRMKFCTDIHGTQEINSDDIGDPLTFLLVLIFGFLCEILTGGWIVMKLGTDFHVHPKTKM